MHHADPLGVYQTQSAGTILECSTGELITRATFTHHDNQGHTALKHYAALKGNNGGLIKLHQKNNVDITDL